LKYGHLNDHAGKHLGGVKNEITLWIKPWGRSEGKIGLGRKKQRKTKGPPGKKNFRKDVKTRSFYQLELKEHKIREDSEAEVRSVFQN